MAASRRAGLLYHWGRDFRVQRVEIDPPSELPRAARPRLSPVCHGSATIIHVSRRVSLPVTDPSAQRPRSTIDAVRARLGGRARTDLQAGRVVCFLDTGATGVVLYGQGDEVHVFSNAGWVRRTTTDALIHVDEPGAELRTVANDVRVFAALEEGHRVRFQDLSGVAQGTLIEKCRYGAVVRRDDATIMGVGFRRIWPLPNPTDTPS